jgi:excisionase family DNA binding protein
VIEPERVYTVPEVAEVLQVGPETVRRWLRRGELQGFMLGGTKLGYRVRGSEIQRFIEAREQAAKRAA